VGNIREPSIDRVPAPTSDIQQAAETNSESLRTLLPRGLKRPIRHTIDTLRVLAGLASMRFRPPLPPRNAGPRGGDPGHLCLLAWFFPPAISGGTYRPLSIARYAAEEGFRVTVIAGERPADDDAAGSYLLSTIPSTVSVAHVPDRKTPFSWASADLDGEKGWLDVYRTFSTAKRTLGAVFPTSIVASGPPFHGFVCALFLARRFGAKLVLDYRDEWTECPFDFVAAGARDRDWERRCLRAADLVVFTTASQMTHQLRAFAELDPGRCHVVPNGWEPSDRLDAASEAAEPAASGMVLSYVGNLGDHTPPLPFLKTLERTIELAPQLASELKLRFVGQKTRLALTQLREFAHPEILQLRDQVPRPSALQEMDRSAALLLLNYDKFERYIPGKLYDYLASGRQIILYGDGGEAAAILRELQAGFVVPEGDAAGLAACLEGLRSHDPSAAVKNERERWLSEHTRRRLALRLLDIVQCREESEL
jgi:glycosyltransferase involved in cell wall biosynthesis